MRWMNKHYIWNVIGWLVIVLLAVLTIPNMSKLVADKGQITVPSSYQSTRATNMQKQWGRSQRGTTAVVVVFNNGNSALTSTQNTAIDHTIQRIKNHENQYEIRSITAASDSSTAASQLISKDKSTQLLQLNVHKSSSHSITSIRSEITKLAKTSGVTTYVTGADVLNQDFSDATQAGVQKTEIIAAIFIFLVLWLVFRSPITPLFSLLTVAVSVITSISVVANLVDRFNFPFSNFTEVFIVIVLFGIGTDYNILLYNEFRERLARGVDKFTATREAIRVGGRTVLYSGLSVLIGMSVLGFANFSLYRSAVGIAVGVIVLLAVLLTLNPFFMAICGPHMFWPVKKFQGEGDSRLWHGMAKHAMIRPVITLIITGIVFVPLALTSHGTLDYDNLVEIGDNVSAKQGFKVVQDHFSKGTAEPTTIYIQSNHKLDNEKSLLLIDRLTKQLQQTEGVKTVASATQPGGKAIKELYVRNQMSTVTGGLVKAQQGVNKINKGLKSAHSQLASQDVSGSVSSANKLASGAKQVSDGTSKLNSGTQSLSSGAKTLSSGTQTLQSGISQVTAGLNQLNTQVSSASGGQQAAQLAQLETALPQLNAAIQQLSSQVANSSTGSTSGVTSSLTTIGTQTKDIATQLQNIKSSMGTVSSISTAKVEAAFTAAGAPLSAAQKQVMASVLAQQTQAQQQLSSALSSSLAKIGSDASAIGAADQSVASQLQSLQSSTGQLQTAVATLAQKSNVVLPGAATALQAASSQSSQLSSATSQLSSAMNTINGKLPQLVTGADALAAGTNKLAASTTQLASGASQVATGNQTMATKLASMSKQLDTLKSGLGTATNGLSSVSTGVGSANGYLKGLQKSSAAKTFYIPSKQLHSKSFAPALKTYLSPNKKLTKLTVVLDDDPSSAAAMARLPKLEKIVNGSLKGTSLGSAKVAFGGNTSQTNDINEMASGDFTRTVIIMLAGIFIALMVVTRSLVQPIVIEGILVVAYSGALTLVHWLVKPVLGTDMLTWNTPFFTFVMLISLGVDYSIFLMRKYREYLHEPGATSDKMLQAATVIGTVVISAGIILSGTFAALIPSGVMTLIQIALAVILGIVLLIILLPIVMPAVMKITYPYPYSNMAREANEAADQGPKHAKD